jgi:formate/nitrite transporter
MQDIPPNEPSPHAEGQVDALLPKQMAKRAEHTGTEKAQQDALSLLVLSLMAGAFIAFGATFAAAVTAGGDSETPIGVTKLAGGFAFSLAYVLAIVGGAELFTTNNLMVMAWAHRRLRTRQLLRAWQIIFVGNFLGATMTGVLLILAGQHTELGGGVGAELLAAAERIQRLSTLDAFLLGILGNTLLCLGVWLTYSARSTTDRILALSPPVAAFYVLGLEHAIAVMFYLPTAALIGAIGDASFWAAIESAPVDITLAGFSRVLLAVTVGNIIGGGVLVALVYWFVYLRPKRGQN